jgi:CTP:molybdopterin cytidylyltransferase MocA
VRVAGLVLAAGEGRRLGTPKGLVEVGGRRLVDRAVSVLQDGGCAPVVVVAGAAELAVPGAVVVPNPDWPTGMGSSLRVGLAALSAEAVVVTLVDTPGVTAAVVDRLVTACAAGADIAVATYDGEPRNPVLLARAHWAEVAELAVGDVGARAFLAHHPELVTPVECGDVADPADIDTPADLERFRR